MFIISASAICYSVFELPVSIGEVYRDEFHVIQKHLVSILTIGSRNSMRVVSECSL